MEITSSDKQIMINTLKTPHLNSVDDLLGNIAIAKDGLSTDVYQLMVNGDEFIYGDDKDLPNKEQYRKITSLDGRWCLKSIIYYHYTRTMKISSDNHKRIMDVL
tara:strand:+ start:134 stop:445 length:312 start_codon:yes stop_codon:yes gene_type:complete